LPVEGTISAALLAFVAEQGDFREDAPTTFVHSNESEKLLNRAAALGVFQPIGAKYYSIHPGLPSNPERFYIARYAAEEQLDKERNPLSFFQHRNASSHGSPGWRRSWAQSIAIETLK